MTIGYFSVIVFFLKMLIPLAIVGIIIALVVTDNNHKKVNVQPVRYDAQGRPVYGGMNVPKKSNYNSSTVLLLIGVSFIILSAIAFVTANWVKLSDESKVFILGALVLLSVDDPGNGAACMQGPSLSDPSRMLIRFVA